MEVVYTDKAKADLEWWTTSGNKKAQQKIIEIIDAILENPTTGVGRPEQLKHHLAGLWSRRINSEHRVVCEIGDDVITIHSTRSHYE